MILWRILKNSHSASLYAIVTSIVLAHYNELFDLFLFLIQDIRFLQLDLHRQINEYHIASMSFVYMSHKDYATERKKSADMEHRKLHLENLLTHLQIAYENSTKDEDKIRLNQLHLCVDKLLNDYKSMKKEATSDEPSWSVSMFVNGQNPQLQWLMALKLFSMNQSSRSILLRTEI